MAIVRRVLARLEEQERAELDPWRREDYRQSWAALYKLHAGKFSDFWSAFVEASYQRYALPPDKVWPAILADRHAKLGREYSRWYDERDAWITENVEDVFARPVREKKPVRPVKDLALSLRAAAPMQLMLWAVPEQLVLWCENTNGPKVGSQRAA